MVLFILLIVRLFKNYKMDELFVDDVDVENDFSKAHNDFLIFNDDRKFLIFKDGCINKMDYDDIVNMVLGFEVNLFEEYLIKKGDFNG